jgi:hypothetical protein
VAASSVAEWRYMTLITAPQVLLAGAFGGRGWVRAEGDRIVGAGWGGPPDPPTIELPRGVLAPGLIDIQINGGYGHDFASADLAGWREVSARLPETGVTAYVPTIITATPQELITSIARYRQLRSEIDTGGARTLGLHCEGPFLAAGQPGAHREDLLLDPTTELMSSCLMPPMGPWRTSPSPRNERVHFERSESWSRPVCASPSGTAMRPTTRSSPQQMQVRPSSRICSTRSGGCTHGPIELTRRPPALARPSTVGTALARSSGSAQAARESPKTIDAGDAPL